MHSPVKEGSVNRLHRVGELAAQAGSLRPSDPGVRRGLHAGIAIVLVLGVGFALVAAAGDFPTVDFRLPPLALLLVLCGMLLYLFGCADLWRRLLRALGPELRPTPAAAIWLASGLGRYVPAALLLPVLRMAMCERADVRKGVCLASVAYEFVFLFTASLIVSAYFVITLPSLSGVWERYLVLALPIIGLLSLHPRVFHTLADRTLERFGRDPLPLSLPGRRVLEFVSLYAVASIAAGLAVYGLALCVYPVGADDLPTIVASYAVANTFSILASVIPGGLGAREAAMAAALSPVMPTAPAVAVPVLSRLVQVGLEVIFASVLSPLLPRSAQPESVVAPVAEP
jgi:glycosyltransferase 2 family protein